MVNNRIVSRQGGTPPDNSDANRSIPSGPLYSEAEVIELIESLGSQAILAWTDKCSRDLQKWTLDAEDLGELLREAFRTGHYRGSEWCVQRPNGPWAACDAYMVRRSEWIPYANREMNVGYYIKFAIAVSGKAILVVSSHPEEDRG